MWIVRVMYMVRPGWIDLFQKILLSSDQQQRRFKLLLWETCGLKELCFQTQDEQNNYLSKSSIDDLAFEFILVTKKNSIIYMVNPSYGGFQFEIIDSNTKQVVATRYVADISRELFYLESKYELAVWCSNLADQTVSPCPKSWFLPWNAVPGGEEDEDEDEIDPEGSKVVSELVSLLELKDNVVHTQQQQQQRLVLKLDGASGGKGVHFIQKSQELLELLRDYRLSQEALPFLEERKQFIAKWAVQRYISSPLLVCGGRKFSLRVFCVLLNSRAFIYPTYEVRVAEEPYVTDAGLQNREADITNGGGPREVNERRFLATEVPELEPFLSRIFPFVQNFMVPKPNGRPKIPETDIWKDRLKDSDEDTNSVMNFRKEFCSKEMGGISAAVVAHDLMMDENGRIYLLETNHSPASPPDNLGGVFGAHLDRLIEDFTSILCWGALKAKACEIGSSLSPPAPWQELL